MKLIFLAQNPPSEPGLSQSF